MSAWIWEHRWLLWGVAAVVVTAWPFVDPHSYRAFWAWWEANS
jgi:hypothetical protein